ncbi:MAG: hypothetical protein EOM67_10140 [Spirochaetia bacterium]|nr:hypothetical protein [Spirochaetia bacterium]
MEVKKFTVVYGKDGNDEFCSDNFREAVDYAKTAVCSSAFPVAIISRVHIIIINVMRNCAIFNFVK